MRLSRQLQEAEGRSKRSWKEVWRGVADAAGIPRDLEELERLEDALRLASGYVPISDELAGWVVLPGDASAVHHPASLARARREGPIAAALLPATDRWPSKLHRSEAPTSRRIAAIAVVERGPEELPEIPVPSGARPFGHTKLDGGLRLKSAPAMASRSRCASGDRSSGLPASPGGGAWAR